MRLFAAASLLLALISCQRERRDFRPLPSSVALPGSSAAESDLRPGGTEPRNAVVNPAFNPYKGNAYAISEGQRLFSWYNCSGCHANGGGGIGPPLIKTGWIYGGEPANLFDTIVKGRPNGMPTWGGRIPEYQIWQIVVYIRSLNNLEPKAATPVRADAIEQDPHTLLPPPGEPGK
jgi:cytochrome c oxidase cbb3-type subunit III